MDMVPGFTLAAILAREDPRDAFVSNAYSTLAALPPGSVVGTSSLRREAQLRERYPQLVVEPLRGNVNTRLHRLDQGNQAAVILASAGLKRLGFAERITALLEPEESLPAIGQGALAVECRADRSDVVAALEPLADARDDFRDRGRARVRSQARGELSHAARGVRGRTRRGAVAAGFISPAATAATLCAERASAVVAATRAMQKRSARRWAMSSLNAAPRRFWRRYRERRAQRRGRGRHPPGPPGRCAVPARLPRWAAGRSCFRPS